MVDREKNFLNQPEYKDTTFFSFYKFILKNLTIFLNNHFKILIICDLYNK